MLKRRMDSISKVGDYYVSLLGVYLKLYGSTKAPHLLPYYMPDKIVLLEIAYQTYVIGFGFMMM